MSWTPDRIERLRGYAAQRLSGREVAAEFGDVSRSGVIAAANRYGIQLNPRLKNDWTPEQDETLLDLWKRGFSQMHIAGVVGFNNTAVKRRLKHHGLTRLRTPQTKRKANVKVQRLYEPTPEMPFLGVTLLDKTEDQCCFPHGDGPILFCGQPKAEHSPSYCGFHHSICYTRPATQEQREQAARQYQARAA